MNRHALAASFCSCLLALLSAGVARAAPRLTPVATAAEPLFLTHAGDERLFVVERQGLIRIFVPSQNQFLATPFLDLRASVSTGGERGLLSMAFHPDYATTRLFYVYYTETDGDLVVERFQTSSDPNAALPSSRVRLLDIEHSQNSNHNGGQLQIGRNDGYLYVATGDGGGGGDPFCAGQNQNSQLGKILRLDVRANINTAPYYGIPPSNPRPTPADAPHAVIWASGLRNPWRFSFDRSTGELYIGDVGQGLREEVDWLPASAAGGRNFGWNAMEGTTCYPTSCPGVPACNSPTLTLPVHEYPHQNSDCSITGGYVYRGSRVPELAGRYLFTDYCSGNLRALRQTSPGVFSASSVLNDGAGVVSFGEDSRGELYVLRGNQILRIESDSPPAVPATGVGAAAALALGLVAAGSVARRSRRS